MKNLLVIFLLIAGIVAGSSAKAQTNVSVEKEANTFGFFTKPLFTDSATGAWPTSFQLRSNHLVIMVPINGTHSAVVLYRARQLSINEMIERYFKEHPIRWDKNQTFEYHIQKKKRQLGFFLEQIRDESTGPDWWGSWLPKDIGYQFTDRAEISVRYGFEWRVS